MKINTKDISYVSIQILLFIAYVFDVKILPLKTFKWISMLGIVLCVLGVAISVISVLQLNKNLSPFPAPKPNSKLIINGVYRYVRHPIYSGIILMTFGYGLYSSSIYKIAIAVLLCALFSLKSSYEEQQLMSKFPEYRDYKAITGRFFPKLG